MRLQPFDRARMLEVGRRVRDLYPASYADRVSRKVDDAVLGALADSVTGALGAKVGVAPRLFLKKLVGLLDRVDLHEDFEVSAYAGVAPSIAEMTPEEASAAGVVRDASALSAVDDLALDEPGS